MFKYAEFFIEDLEKTITKLRKELSMVSLREEFYKIRVEEIEKMFHAYNDSIPEPIKTYICNILANGRIKP